MAHGLPRAQKVGPGLNLKDQILDGRGDADSMARTRGSELCDVAAILVSRWAWQAELVGHVH